MLGDPHSPVKRLLHVLLPEASLTADRRWIASQFTSLLKLFRAHVTLARKVPPGTHDCFMQSVLWTIGECALMESRTGPGGSLYSVLHPRPLCAETREMPEKKDK